MHSISFRADNLALDHRLPQDSFYQDWAKDRPAYKVDGAESEEIASGVVTKKEEQMKNKTRLPSAYAVNVGPTTAQNLVP